RHVPKTMLKLEANSEYYWGKPRIRNLILKLAEWQGESMPELLSGDVDAASFLRRADVLQLSKDRRFAVYQQLDHNPVGVLCWNLNNPLFRDDKVRRALTLAINRRELAQVLNYPGQTPVLDAPLSRGQLERQDFAEPIPYDPELANRLLDSAG